MLRRVVERGCEECMLDEGWEIMWRRIRNVHDRIFRSQ